MINREYKIYNLNDKKEEICVLCECHNSETLNTFLNSDVRAFYEWINSDIKKVLSGELLSKNISGNVCCAEITQKRTKIYDTLIEDDEEYEATCCEVDTEDLSELIDEWIAKFKDYKK